MKDVSENGRLVIEAAEEACRAFLAECRLSRVPELAKALGADPNADLTELLQGYLKEEDFPQMEGTEKTGVTLAKISLWIKEWIDIHESKCMLVFLEKEAAAAVLADLKSNAEDDEGISWVIMMEAEVRLKKAELAVSALSQKSLQAEIINDLIGTILLLLEFKDAVYEGFRSMFAEIRQKASIEAESAETPSEAAESSDDNGPKTYSYTGLDSQGVEVNDTVEAVSEKEAIAQIRQLGIFPTKVGLKKEDPPSSE